MSDPGNKRHPCYKVFPAEIQKIEIAIAEIVLAS